MQLARGQRNAGDDRLHAACTRTAKLRRRSTSCSLHADSKTSGDDGPEAICGQTALRRRSHNVRATRQQRDQDPCTLALRANRRSACEELAGRVIIVTASRQPLSARSHTRSGLTDGPQETNTVVEYVQRADGSFGPRKIHSVFSSAANTQSR